MKSISIGPHTYERPLFMAPMEGITDVPFRKIVRKHGCGIICTQMIHAEAMLLAPGHRLEEVTAMTADEQPIGFQLCCPDPVLIGKAAKMAEQRGAAFIDVNMGCPAKSVVSRGAGAALLKDPMRAGAIVREIRRSVTIPITVKIRSGWDDTHRSGPEVARIVEQEGAALVSVHARTKAQEHKGMANWDLIQELKTFVKIPVVGNGGVFAPADVERMLSETGADGVMIARGALGNPWIFSLKRPSVTEIRNTLLEHMDAHLAFYKKQDLALLTFRKHIVWYTKGLRNAADFRVKLFQNKSYELIIEMIRRFFDQLDPLSYPNIE